MNRTLLPCLALGLAAALAPTANADIVHLDDVIIDGSACVGFDCVNGEAFGSDTIRLKENNLRIHFEDTSTGAFPSNDWRITANSSANGGANFLSFDDATGGKTPFLVEAGARTNALYVEADGDVGFGTSDPAVNLHAVDGNTPTLRLEQDGSSGFTPQTWDLAGNETNFFLRDVTNGSKLPFRSRPGAPTSSIDIAASGNVGFGATSPDSALHVKRSTGSPLSGLKIENNAGSYFEMLNTGTNDTWFFTHENANEGRFIIASFVDGVGDGPEFSLTTSGDLTIAGQLITNGPQCPIATPCDGTFQPNFQVPTVEEHAEYMWKNSHLRGVGSTKPGEPINLTEKAAGILHELEVAHIYIEQLNNRLKEMDTLKARLAALESKQ